jgi:hypothetical protein
VVGFYERKAETNVEHVLRLSVWPNGPVIQEEKELPNWKRKTIPKNAFGEEVAATPFLVRRRVQAAREVAAAAAAAV